MRREKDSESETPRKKPPDVLAVFFIFRLLMHVTDKEHASMEKANSVELRIPPNELSVFDGFPYLLTRMSPGFFHLIFLPRGELLNFLLAIAGSQAFLNQLLTVLVLDHDLCYSWRGSGPAKRSTTPPSGGVITFDQIKPFKEFQVTCELAGRIEKLATFGRQLDGTLFGDLTKGAHRGTEEELQRLTGFQENGVPLGLARCSICGQWRGDCLDPHPILQSDAVTVHCQCENNNLCAGCGRLLHRHRLNANYFCEGDRRIWHVPGFSAFGHHCQEVQGVIDEASIPERPSRN